MFDNDFYESFYYEIDQNGNETAVRFPFDEMWKAYAEQIKKERDEKLLNALVGMINV